MPYILQAPTFNIESLNITYTPTNNLYSLNVLADDQHGNMTISEWWNYRTTYKHIITHVSQTCNELQTQFIVDNMLITPEEMDIAVSDDAPNINIHVTAFELMIYCYVSDSVYFNDIYQEVVDSMSKTVDLRAYSMSTVEIYKLIDVPHDELVETIIETINTYNIEHKYNTLVSGNRVGIFTNNAIVGDWVEMDNALTLYSAFYYNDSDRYFIISNFVRSHQHSPDHEYGVDTICEKYDVDVIDVRNAIGKCRLVNYPHIDKHIVDECTIDVNGLYLILSHTQNVGPFKTVCMLLDAYIHSTHVSSEYTVFENCIEPYMGFILDNPKYIGIDNYLISKGCVDVATIADKFIDLLPTNTTAYTVGGTVLYNANVLDDYFDRMLLENRRTNYDNVDVFPYGDISQLDHEELVGILLKCTPNQLGDIALYTTHMPDVAECILNRHNVCHHAVNVYAKYGGDEVMEVLLTQPSGHPAMCGEVIDLIRTRYDN